MTTPTTPTLVPTSPWTSVHEVIEDITGGALDEHPPSAHLSDLGIDSIAAMELLLAVEDDLGRPVAIEALESLRTVGELIDLLGALRSEACS